MPDRPEKSSEGLERREAEAQKEKQQETSEISEVVRGTEVPEFLGGGEVSEKASKRKETSASGMPVTQQTDTAVAGGEQELPNVDVMRVQISTRIRKEITALEKEASRMMRNPAKFEPFQMNLVVGKIRRLRDILAGLAHSTGETVKTLWQKFVKGVM